MLKLNFTSPFPHSQRSEIIKAFRSLGLNYERIYQPGPYSLHRFYGRLPNNESDANVKIHFTDEYTKEQFELNRSSNYIEIFINIERE